MQSSELEAEALRLPARDRARLAENLLLSLDEGEEPEIFTLRSFVEGYVPIPLPAIFGHQPSPPKVRSLAA